MTMQVIQRYELTSATNTISFTSIPQTHTDLLLVISARTTDGATYSGYRISFNGSQANFSRRILYGNGSGVASESQTSAFFNANGSGTTSNTFTSNSVYFANYTASAAKSMSYEIIMENNASTSLQLIGAGLWNVTTAISSLDLIAETSNFVSGTSATLYGITKGSDGTTTVS